MQQILNDLLGKQYRYKDKFITIKSWKKINSTYVIISDKRTYNFYENEIVVFVNSLERVLVKLKEGVLEKRKMDRIKNVKMENLVINNEEINKEELDIKDVLFNTIKKVQNDKSYIAQANAICNITSQLINLKKLQLLIQSKK